MKKRENIETIYCSIGSSTPSKKITIEDETDYSAWTGTAVVLDKITGSELSRRTVEPDTANGFNFYLIPSETENLEVGEYDIGYEISNGSVSSGQELLVSSEIDDPLFWEEETGWTISGGEAICDGTDQATLVPEAHAGLYPSGYNVQIEGIIEISTINSGSITIKSDGYDIVTYDSPGTYTFKYPVRESEYVVPVEIVSNSFNGNINRLSLKEYYLPIREEFHYTLCLNPRRV